MKHLIVLAICLFGSASASYLHGDIHAAPAVVHPHVAAVNTGSSTQYRSQDNLGNYAFGYNEQHSTGGSFRREQSDVLGNKVGSYGLTDADGRVRVVNYVADGHGFRAAIATNEPGTAAQPAASTSISSPHVVAAAPVLHAEPAIHSPVVAPYGHELGHHGHLQGHLHAAPAIGITGPAAILPSHLHHGHPGLLAAPSHYGSHYGLADAHAHAYPIRR